MNPGNEQIVLIVDDNPTNLSVLSEHLRAEGYKISTAKSGEKALKQVKRIMPHMILLDVMMPPGIDGFETCHRLKEDEETKHIPVIFMTALTDTFNKVKGFEIKEIFTPNNRFDNISEWYIKTKKKVIF